jgi:hypothetical protein
MRHFFLLAALGLASTAPRAALAQSETVTVDAGSNRHAIDPRIYGVAYGDQASLADLNATLNRYGGNPATRYNWTANADNRGSDWYFESIGDASATAGERGDTFIATSRGGGADALLTIPTLGWVAKLGANRGTLAGFSIAKYGAQTGSDPYFPDAGTGILASGQNVTGNDPNDADVPSDSAYQASWVRHLVSTWGTAAQGGLRYYILDNEPSIWQGTHRDVFPTGATMQEIVDRIVDYGSMIKAIDPGATVIGPEEWGWSGYLYSGYDQQYGAAHGYSSYPDRAAHGNMDYLPWVLDQLRQKDAATGQRLLDVFTVHYYPQGGEFGNDTSTATQLLRNRSTRSLWDPTYVDQSWINDKVNLIARLKGWVAAYYPGTAVGLTEYNWGAEANMNGATAQADILGILGREGLDLATRWTAPDPSTPTYKAMKLYRNYDGQKSTFGETSVAASVANPDNLAAFAAVRADGALTVMVVNKVLTGSTTLTLDLASFTASGPAQVWQLTSANAIDRLADLNASGAALTTTLLAQSVTLFVIPGNGTPLPPATTTTPAGASPVTTASAPAAPPAPSVTSPGSTASAATPASAGAGGGGGCALEASRGGTGSLAPLALVLLLAAGRRRPVAGSSTATPDTGARRRACPARAAPWSASAFAATMNIRTACTRPCPSGSTGRRRSAVHRAAPSHRSLVR